MNVFVKLLGDNIPPGEIAFARGFFGTVAGAHYHVCEGHPIFKRGSGARHAWPIRRFWYGL